jgi:hypothetical protein
MGASGVGGRGVSQVAGEATERLGIVSWLDSAHLRVTPDAALDLVLAEADARLGEGGEGRPTESDGGT